ncbi:hypothetical protein PAXRUDRAFT_153728 [Paxillus rubicundulus Ve08.2h10]|uniref:Uncharacterized protein n=1 Tax=Paxillus rubicundulus Ve08.2h10 TaxID=930991 RepID=A0A0D0D369_9AGAM|nr:hypothetical protein PAXRUDRAFT_153728 [Paxillus rubicundulus Ve08.2h10]
MSLPHRQELLDFQMNNSNFMKMIHMGRHLSSKLKKNVLSTSRAGFRAFDKINSGVPEAERCDWMDMEHAALNMWVDDPSAMVIFPLQANKGVFQGSTSPMPSTHDFNEASSVLTVDMDLLPACFLS